MSGSMESIQHKVNKGPRACSTCAKAKSRCVPGPVSSKCERCHRLNKPCSSQTPAPPRKRKEPKTTRVAELERRLEDLTSRIEKQQVPSPPESSVSGPVTGPPVYPSRPCTTFDHLFAPEGVRYPVDHEHAPTATAVTAATIADDVRRRTNSWNFSNQIFSSEPALQPEPTPRSVLTPASTPRASQTSLWPRGEEADTLLADYKSRMEHLFPFAIVPPDMTSEQLRQKRPFLWKAVMMATFNLDGLRQITLGNQLLRDIAEAATMKPQKGIDLLQGLHILIAWFHYNLNSFQMTNLLYLARSICVSLGLSESRGMMKESDYTSECFEQMRGFVGTYYLVTVIFTTNKKPDALMSTSYLAACCRILESRMEYPTDGLLVWLVRAQQLSQSISQTFAFRTNENLQPTSDLPMSLIIKSFQQQLETFKSSIPEHIKSNQSLVGHQYIAAILLYEVGLQENCPLPVKDRLESLWACVTAAKGFFRNKYAGKQSHEPEFACMSSFDFFYAFLTMLKLVTLVAPGWDLKVVRQELKFDDLVDKQIDEMELLAERRRTRQIPSPNRAASAGAGVGGDDAVTPQDPFSMLAEKLKLFRDVLCGSLDSAFNDKLAKAATAGAMTITDATQGIVEDLESNLWQTMMGATADWASFDASIFQACAF